MGVADGLKPPPLGRIVHALDRRNDVFVASQSVISVGEIPKIPVGVEGIKAHRLFQKLNRLRRLLGVDERVGVFCDNVAVVWIERHGVRIFDERFLELFAIELGVAQFGKAASIERVELLGAAREIGCDLERFIGGCGPRIAPVEIVCA